MEPGIIRRNLLWIIMALLAAGMVIRFILHEKPVSMEEKNERSETLDRTRYAKESSRIGEYIMRSSSSDMSENKNIFNFENENTDAKIIVIDLEKEADNTDDGVMGTLSSGVYVFEVDNSGQLVLNEKTRLAIERLHALNTPEELKEKLQQFSDILLPNAQSEVVNLLEDFEKYSFDLKEISQYNFTPETAEEALSYLQELHDLRVLHFGKDVARAFFEKEESMNREMLELVYRENNSDM